MKKKITIITLLSMPTALFMATSNAATFDSVSHFHNLKVAGSKVLLGTHEGLFLLKGKNNMQQIGKENFDVMGLAVSGSTIYASGHPGSGSKLPTPVGFIKSTDGGVTWKAISLQGKVDFHLLEGVKSEFYGVDSQTGNLLYSNNSGATWKGLGSDQFNDIALSPTSKKVAVALNSQNLVVTSDAFGSTKTIKSDLKFSQVEWIKSGIYAISGKSLYMSADNTKTWMKMAAFKAEPGLFSANDSLMAVTIGSDIYLSKDSGETFNVVK